MTQIRNGVCPQKFILTKKEVLALLEGKVLGDPDFNEYGTFIVMEKEDTDETRL